MTALIDIAYLIALLAVSPMAIYRMLRHGRYRAGWANRFGKISRKRPDKKCIWIHAVSVGEVNATTTLIRELEAKFPDYEIAISTTTDTGFARANALFGSRLSVFYFPMDFSLTMKRAFANIRPAMCLLIELEVWPNLVRIAKQSDIPVIIVNGRLSERSLRRYGLIKGVTKKIFGNLTLALAQSEEYAERFRQLGMPAELLWRPLRRSTVFLHQKRYCFLFVIPKNRNRLVLLASKLGPIELLSADVFGAERKTVRKVIERDARQQEFLRTLFLLTPGVLLS